jgi:prepilin-type N-terminal cleavage/methylation domain-containing protein
MKAVQKKSGFTLAELLIVVAILSVLIAIIKPQINGQIEKANNAVDMSTMRAAYSEFMVEHIDGKVQTGTTYYYNPSGTDKFTSTSASAGYGKSKTSADKWWKGVGSATGTPKNNGKSATLRLKMDDAGNVNFHWGGGAYTGLNVTSEMYQKMKSGETVTQTQADTGKTGTFVKEFIDRDKVLLDSLDAEFQNMTYGQLRDLFLNPDGTNKTDKGNLRVDNKDHVCFVIAKSSITTDGLVNSNKDNRIYFEDIFKNAGYDTSLASNETYIINSVTTNNKTNTVWVDLGISYNELKNLKDTDPKWNDTANKAYTYVKSDQEMTPNELRQINRVRK